MACSDLQTPNVAAWPPPEAHDRAEVMLLEIIMTQHWDMAACPCWICAEGRALGCGPREKYLRRVTRAPVHVDSEIWAYRAYRRDTTAPPSSSSSSIQKMADPYKARRAKARNS